MAFSRYRSSPILSLGSQFGTSRAVSAVRRRIADGTISINTSIILKENQRLDHLAWIYYKDGRYWWVLAAASDVGWGLQVPAGTIINVPNIDDVATVIG